MWCQGRYLTGFLKRYRQHIWATTSRPFPGFCIWIGYSLYIILQDLINDGSSKGWDNGLAPIRCHVIIRVATSLQHIIYLIIRSFQEILALMSWHHVSNYFQWIPRILVWLGLRSLLEVLQSSTSNFPSEWQPLKMSGLQRDSFVEKHMFSRRWNMITPTWPTGSASGNRAPA